MSAASATSAPDEVLSVRDLDVEFGDNQLVHDVNFAIKAGERVGLIGESGSGKSLTSLSAMGLLPEGLAATGSIELAGVDFDLIGADERGMSKIRGKDLAMVFQEPMTALNPTMKVGKQVAETLLLHGTCTGKREALERAAELLDLVGIPNPSSSLDSYPHQFSGGQRQRIVLAIALANDPSVIICDEPTTALDVTVQEKVLQLILRCAEKQDAALLFITHDLAVVASVCERVMVMYKGRIVESGPVREVFTQPKHSYTKSLLAASNLSDAVRLRQRESVAPAEHRIEVSEQDRPALASEPLNPEAALSLRDIKKTYHRPGGSTVEALKGITVDIAKGEQFGIVGESGCGKSTLLRIVSGLDRASSGSVMLEGTDITHLRDRQLKPLRRRLQLVFQDPMGSLDPRMRVGEIVAEPLIAQGETGYKARVAELLEAVGLPAQAADRYPHQFSGGQRQRISIARALAPKPQIVVADEPVSALDVSVRAQVLNLLADLVDELGITLVFVSHDLSVVRHVCERVAVMNAGQIVEIGPTEDVYNNPKHDYTKGLISAIPTIEKSLRGA